MSQRGRRLLPLIVVLSLACSRSVAAAGECGAADSRIIVDTSKHRLALCEQGSETAAFDVRLGRGGLGKRAEGDGKTPLGTYSLGTPRPSKRYGVFIPVGYPTPDQRAQGFTGSDVGVHGPPRWVRWLGSLVNTFDSSDGCIGVAKDAEMNAIATWMGKVGARVIEIR